MRILLFLFFFCHVALGQQPPVEFQPYYEFGDDSLVKFIKANTIIPQAALEKWKEGHVLTSFLVDTSGAISSPSIMMSSDSLLNQEAIRVVSLTAKHWKPGRRDGVPVAMPINLPVRFRILKMCMAKEDSLQGVVDKPEVEPLFKGGDKALSRFLINNIEYPQVAKENGVEGWVCATMIIDTNGRVIEPRILIGLDTSINAELLRVMKLMEGKWKPGYDGRHPVRVRLIQSIKFSSGVSRWDTLYTLFNTMGATWSDPEDGINWIKVRDSEDSYSLGLKHLADGDTARAMEYFEKAVVLNKGHRDALFNLVVLKILSNDVQVACEYIERLIKLKDPEATTLKEKYCVH